MSDDTDNRASNVRSLQDAIRKVRTAETERSDVVVELRDAERARLETLADELRSVFDEVPADDEQFLFTVAAGLPPRLWIDMTAFVVMGRDRRTYRFLKDTRLGRTIILESANLNDVADTITDYVAERIIERERAIEGDWLLKRIMRDEAGQKRAGRAEEAREARTTERAEPRRNVDGGQLGWLVAAFMGGALIAAMALFGAAWFAVG